MTAGNVSIKCSTADFVGSDLHFHTDEQSPHMVAPIHRAWVWRGGRHRPLRLEPPALNRACLSRSSIIDSQGPLSETDKSRSALAAATPQSAPYPTLVRHICR